MSHEHDRTQSDADAARRDPQCGEPGGGRGRRDETGRTGIWPMSGPLPPPADAPTIGQGELGHGGRGHVDRGSTEAAACRTDPVCGSHVDPGHASATADWSGTTYFFDSPECRRRFGEAPARYTGLPAHPHRGAEA